MDRRVEALADRRHGHDPDALEGGLELADDKLQAAHEELLGAGLAGVLDRTAQIVEHREQSAIAASSLSYRRASASS